MSAASPGGRPPVTPAETSPGGQPPAPPAEAPEAGRPGPAAAAPAGARSVDELLAAARARLSRLSPAQAFAAAQAGAVLIDIRPAGQRAADGEIPGSVVIERNHLEWRLDPASGARLPWADRYDLRTIVFCEEGYTSSLAAAALQDLGLAQATDVDGGYRAWQAAGLPTARPDEKTVTIAPKASPAW